MMKRKYFPELLSVVPLENFELLLQFSNDEKRVFDFKPNLTHPFYLDLSNPRLFKNITVVDGQIEWATGQDFCPHTLYEKSTILAS